MTEMDQLKDRVLDLESWVHNELEYLKARIGLIEDSGRRKRIKGHDPVLEEQCVK